MEEQLAKYFSGELTQDEIKEIHSWRNESSDHAKVFLEAKNIWLSSSEIPVSNPAVLDQILNKKNAKVVSASFTWLRYAAAAAVVLGVVLTIYLTSGGNNSKGFQRLADGTEVTLHTNSMIESVNITDQIREVTLTGKAYFDVKRDESRPFIIRTENARIEVLGTSFVIDASNKKTEVCVESGLVSLVKPGSPGRPDLSVKLTEGEVGTVNNTNRGILKRNNNNANYLAWKTKSVVFERASMSEVAHVLEDVYGIQVEFGSPQLSQCNLTAKFKERRAKEAVEIIARTFNLTYKFRENRVILEGKGC